MAVALIAVCCIVAALHILSALTLDRVIEYTDVPFASPRVPAGLDGYKIAFISDIHGLSARDLERVARRLGEERLDLLAFGGDFPDDKQAMERAVAVLSKVGTTDGLYGVEGNHDDGESLFPALERHGVRPLANSGVRVRKHLYIAGVRDRLRHNADIVAATAGAGEDDFVLLLAHNPDVTMEQDVHPADLVLCGHTHGGQITLLGLWAPALTLTRHVTRYGQRFQSGRSASRDDVPVYVSRGVGSFAPRVFARPQVVLVTLMSDPERPPVV